MLTAKNDSCLAQIVLVIDDDIDTLALVQEALEEEGYIVITAMTGVEGVAMFQLYTPDCVLLDVRMAGVDGFAACAQIRQLPYGANAAIIFLTAMRNVETFDKALRVGGDDFLTKPINLFELLQRVQIVIKLKQMTVEMNEMMRQQRDNLVRLKLHGERLATFVVHDLKIPVCAIDLHAQLLLREANLTERAKSSIQEIRNEAKSLLKLLLNLLDISKSNEGQLVAQHDDVDLDELTTCVVKEFNIAAKDSSIMLSRDIRVKRLDADAALLRRVMQNLVDNSIRHAPKHTEVQLISIAKDDVVEILVVNAGPAVTSDMQAEMFNRFTTEQSEQSSGIVSNHGLGLAFCKLAAEAHGGDISVKNLYPGVAFCLRLPQGRSSNDGRMHAG